MAYSVVRSSCTHTEYITDASPHGVISGSAGDVAYDSNGKLWICTGTTNWTDLTTNQCRIKTGTYTGNGATSYGITGIGFAPKYVKIRRVDAGSEHIFETTDTAVDNDALGFAWRHTSGGGHASTTNAIISLDADGFTVDDDGSDQHPNANGVVYDYLCLG